MSTQKLPGKGGSYTRDPESNKLTQTAHTKPAEKRGKPATAKRKPAAKSGSKKED